MFEVTGGQGYLSVPGCSGTTSCAANCPEDLPRLRNGGSGVMGGEERGRRGHARKTWVDWSKPRGVHSVEVMESILGDTQNSTGPDPGQPAPSFPSCLSFDRGVGQSPPQLPVNTSMPMDSTTPIPSCSQPALPKVSKEQR